MIKLNTGFVEQKALIEFLDTVLESTHIPGPKTPRGRIAERVKAAEAGTVAVYTDNKRDPIVVLHREKGLCVHADMQLNLTHERMLRKIMIKHADKEPLVCLPKS
ncbi:hypothetical protein [Vibrio phage BONAISHI]|nr:hypothetical protein [Vibrio phage BONAISHI]